MTINSDIDAASVEKFNAVHTLVNGTNWIVAGSELLDLLLDGTVKDALAAEGGISGFGLPLADSFRLYGAAVSVYERFDYVTGQPVPHAHQGRDLRDIVDEWFRKGWLDTLHSPGKGEVRRQAAEAGFAWMAERPWRSVRVWTNHDSTVTPSDIGPDGQRALVLLSKNLIKQFTALLCHIGAGTLAHKIAADPYPQPFPPGQRLTGWTLSILFVMAWTLVLGTVALPRFRRRAHLICSIGFLAAMVLVMHRVRICYHLGDDPSSPYYCADLARQQGFVYYWLLEDVPQCPAVLLNTLPLPESEVSGRASILRVCRLDDGAPVFVFPRSYRGVNAEGSLELLTEENLEDLCRRQGTSILCTHWTSQPKSVFTAKGLQGLRNLKKFHDAGKVWVAPTSVVLDFDFARAFLRYTVQLQNSKRVIRVVGLSDAAGTPMVPTLSKLRGISFDCPSDRPVGVELAGVEIDGAALDMIPLGERTIVRIPF